LSRFPENFLTLKRISCHNSAGSKKRLLEEVGSLLAGPVQGLSRERVFDRLLERERLGSTGLGQGIALPHARMEGVDQAIGALVQLRTGLDFDAIDNRSVDLVFGLLVPEKATNEHLELLAKLASLFSDRDFSARLREAPDPEIILKTFQQRETLARSA
jgi:PTS system nitrogen regulatory IIA component